MKWKMRMENSGVYINCSCVDPNYCYSNYTDSKTGGLRMTNDTLSTYYNTFVFDNVKEAYKSKVYPGFLTLNVSQTLKYE